MMMMEKSSNSASDESDKHVLISLCTDTKISELSEKLALPQYQQLLCAPLNSHSETILHYMCAYPVEHVEVVNTLLDNGADVCINKGPVTPLSLAAQRNHKELVRLLLNRGANPELSMHHPTNPEVHQIMQKKLHEMRRAPKNMQQDAQKNMVSVAISKQLSSLFPFIETLTTADIQKISDQFAKATSFSDIATAYQIICEHHKPEGEKQVAEFVVALLLLPWGLPALARHVAVDRHNHANRIAELLFNTTPAYKIAVFVESRLSNFEKDRPRSSFPRLYVTLVNAIADTIIASLIGSSQPSDDMGVLTAKLLKWITAIGFVSTHSNAEIGSILKTRMISKSLSLATRHLCPRLPEVSLFLSTPDSNAPPHSSNFTHIHSASPAIPLSPDPVNAASPPDSATQAPNQTTQSIPPQPKTHQHPPPPTTAWTIANWTANTNTNTRVSTPPLGTNLIAKLSQQTATPPKHALQSTSPRSTSPQTTSPRSSSPIRPVTPPPRTATPPTGTSTVPSIIYAGPAVPATSVLHVPATPSRSSAYMVTIKLEHPTGGFHLKLYNTTALAVLHDKIAARLRSRMGSSPIGSESPFNFVLVCPDGRKIQTNEEGVIGDLEHPDNTVELRLQSGVFLSLPF